MLCNTLVQGLRDSLSKEPRVFVVGNGVQGRIDKNGKGKWKIVGEKAYRLSFDVPSDTDWSNFDIVDFITKWVHRILVDEV